MGAIYEIYIDVLAVNSFFADLAALTAVSIFLKKRARAYRILAGALLGTLGSCLVFTSCNNPVAYLLLVHFAVNPCVLYFSFREKSRKVFFRDLCAGYFAFLVLGGAMEWLYAGGSGIFSYGTAAAAALLVLAAGVLWGVGQLWSRCRYLDAKICGEKGSIHIKALSDSGNLLRDPYTGRPVSMIDREIYEMAYGTPQAVRFIPYESLGCRHGLLEAVTVEELSFVHGNGRERIPHAVLGLAEHALFEGKPYGMIINPQELWRTH